MFPDILRIIAAHRTAGDRTYLVTTNPIELAAPVAAALDMDQARGSRPHIGPDGRYTGELDGPLLHGHAKAAEILELSREHNIDLRRSHAYSDSIHDRELLEAVGYPHAVNPDPNLLDIAVQNGWAIHELRPIRRQTLVRSYGVFDLESGG